MNKLTGQIVFIESSESMSMIDVNVDGDVFSAIVLETPKTAGYLKIGEIVVLLFKETEVSIAKNFSGMISLRNRIKSKIKQIETDVLLTKIVLEYGSAQIVSIISTRSAQKLELKIGDPVEWLLKTNEISLSPTG